MLPSSLLVFDLETVVDEEFCRSVFRCPDMDTLSCEEAVADYHESSTSSPFPRQIFFKVVAIGCVFCDITGGNENNIIFGRSGSMGDIEEKPMLTEFFRFIKEKKPRLVSFNGRGFDIPVLKYRALKHGLNCSPLDSKDYYNNRYNTGWHCDLLDVFSDFGASSRNVKLKEVCSLIGIPGKFGPEGSSVASMYRNGDISAIKDYAETDAISTYLIYLRYALRTGTIMDCAYSKAVDDLGQYLRQSNKARLQEYYSLWH